jgi:hypothetical protein
VTGEKLRAIMRSMKKRPYRAPADKKRRLRETDRLTVPPRLEGKSKNAKMNPVRKRPSKRERASLRKNGKQRR